MAISVAIDPLDNGYEDTAPVGSYPDGASPYGVLNMAGNAGEWVADWYSEVYYRKSPNVNPTGPSSGDYRVLRGGSWNLFGWYVHSTYRYNNLPSTPYLNSGFRCAASP